MNEREYIILSNLQRLRIITDVMHNILKGDEYHVPEKEYYAINRMLSRWVSDLEDEIII